jgi:hypothetical protein
MPKMFGDESHPKDLLGEEKYDNDSSIQFHLTFSSPTSSYARWGIPLYWVKLPVQSDRLH